MTAAIKEMTTPAEDFYSDSSDYDYAYIRWVYHVYNIGLVELNCSNSPLFMLTWFDNNCSENALVSPEKGSLEYREDRESLVRYILFIKAFKNLLIWVYVIYKHTQCS